MPKCLCAISTFSFSSLQNFQVYHNSIHTLTLDFLQSMSFLCSSAFYRHLKHMLFGVYCQCFVSYFDWLLVVCYDWPGVSIESEVGSWFMLNMRN